MDGPYLLIKLFLDELSDVREIDGEERESAYPLLTGTPAEDREQERDKTGHGRHGKQEAGARCHGEIGGMQGAHGNRAWL